jgi:hypothetical protein
MSGTTNYKRTSDDVGILLINPEGQPHINYYYCLVDLPMSDSLQIDSGTYNSESKTLTFSFEYLDQKYPDPSTELQSYITPAYLIQTEEGKPLDVKTVELVGTLNGESTTVKTGETVNQKKKVLVGLPKLEALSESDKGGSEPAPIDELRPMVLESETIPADTFVIILVRTSAENERILQLTGVPLEDNKIGIEVAYIESGLPSSGNGFVAATNFIVSQTILFKSAYLNTLSPPVYIPIDYKSATKV